MKLFALVFGIMSFFTSCKCNQAASAMNSKTDSVSSEVASDLPKIIYESHTRGFYKLITIENGKIAVLTARNGLPVSKTLTKSDIDTLSTILNKLDFEKIPTLKAPTEKRFYDGAPITNLEVIKTNQSYKTTDFDGGFPPAYIEELVNKILEIAEKVQ